MKVFSELQGMLRFIKKKKSKIKNEKGPQRDHYRREVLHFFCVWRLDCVQRFHQTEDVLQQQINAGLYQDVLPN